MVVLSFVKYGNIHNAINFTFSIPCDAYLHIFYGLLHTFSSGPLRFCQQKHFSSYLLDIWVPLTSVYINQLQIRYKMFILYSQFYEWWKLESRYYKKREETFLKQGM